MATYTLGPAHRHHHPDAQLGTFPFDNVKFQDPDSDDAHRELWLQQIERTWSNVPHIHAIVNMVGARHTAVCNASLCGRCSIGSIVSDLRASSNDGSHLY